MEVGSCVFELNEQARKEMSEKFPAFTKYFNELGCVVWRGQKKYSFVFCFMISINILVTKEDIETMKRILTME